MDVHGGNTASLPSSTQMSRSDASKDRCVDDRLTSQGKEPTQSHNVSPLLPFEPASRLQEGSSSMSLSIPTQTRPGITTPKSAAVESSEEHTTKEDCAPANIVMKQSPFPLSWLELTIHILSLTCSAVIIWLCASQVYFKAADIKYVNLYLNAFQVVATVHTAIIGCSLSTITMYQVLYELALEQGVPFVYLTYPSQLASITIFFRPSFWRTFVSKERTWRTLMLGCGFLMAALLQAAVAPASATLIVPQLGFWNVRHPFGGTNGFAYFSSSHQYVWPTMVNESTVDYKCKSDTGLFIPEFCPHANIAGIMKWVENRRDHFSPSNITATADGNELRYVGASEFNTSAPGYSAASTPMSSCSRVFGSIWQYAQRNSRIPFRKFHRPVLSLKPTNASLSIMRPLVQTQCRTHYYPWNLTGSELEITFVGNQLKGAAGQAFTNTNMTINTTEYVRNSPVVQFMDLSSNSLEMVVGILFGFGSTSRSAAPNARWTTLIPCMVVAHWIPTNLTSEPATSNVVYMDHPNPQMAAANPKIMSHAVPIELNMTYLNLVNLPLPTGSNVFQSVASGFTHDGHTFDRDQGDSWEWRMAALTSLQLSDALSRIHVYNASMSVFCEGCSSNSTAGPNTIQDLGVIANPAFEHIESRSSKEVKNDVFAHLDSNVPVEWRVHRYGYGWSLEGITRVLALGVILVHSLLVLIHIAMVTIRQKQFKAWDGIAQLMGLANKSPCLTELSKLGCGVAEKGSYATNVMIRSSLLGAEEKVILTNDGKYAKIEESKKYR